MRAGHTSPRSEKRKTVREFVDRCKDWGLYTHSPCIQPAAIVSFHEALSTANSIFQNCTRTHTYTHARVHTQGEQLKMVQENEFRTEGARQAGGWYGTLNHQVGGQRVVATSHRHIDEMAWQ